MKKYNIGRDTGKHIYVTRNYDAFNRLVGNREVTTSRKNKIISSIKTYGYHTSPLLVNENMDVIDGQGRLAALKELQMPVEYIIEPGIGIEECRAMNINNSKWTMNDYIKSYAEEGLQSYIWLKNAIEQYPLLSLDVINYVFTGLISKSSDDIKSGKYSVTIEAYKASHAMLEYINKFTCIKGKIPGRACLFFIAIGFAYSMQDVDRKRLYNQVLKRIDTMIPFSNIHQCLTSVEDVYNARLNKKNEVYLENSYRQAIAGRLPWYTNKWGVKFE